MNEQIRQLADQAHEYASGVYDRRIATEGPENVFFYQISNEKFAELIVQECVAICKDIDGEDNIDARSGRQDCAVEIREHFGVE
jgi:hypothetical protein